MLIFALPGEESLRKLYDYLYYGLQNCFAMPITKISRVLLNDYKRAGLKGKPEFFKARSKTIYHTDKIS